MFRSKHHTYVAKITYGTFRNMGFFVFCDVMFRFRRIFFWSVLTMHHHVVRVVLAGVHFLAVFWDELIAWPSKPCTMSWRIAKKEKCLRTVGVTQPSGTPPLLLFVCLYISSEGGTAASRRSSRSSSARTDRGPARWCSWRTPGQVRTVNGNVCFDQSTVVHSAANSARTNNTQCRSHIRFLVTAVLHSSHSIAD